MAAVRTLDWRAGLGWAGLGWAGWAGLGWAEHDCSMTRQYFLLTKVAACTLGPGSAAVAEIIDLDQQAQ